MATTVVSVLESLRLRRICRRRNDTDTVREGCGGRIRAADSAMVTLQRFAYRIFASVYPAIVITDREPQLQKKARMS